jgi:hypothetical protein
MKVSFQMTATQQNAGSSEPTASRPSARAGSGPAIAQKRAASAAQYIPLSSTSMPNGPGTTLSVARHTSAIRMGCWSLNTPLRACSSWLPESRDMNPG